MMPNFYAISVSVRTFYALPDVQRTNMPCRKRVRGELLQQTALRGVQDEPRRMYPFELLSRALGNQPNVFADKVGRLKNLRGKLVLCLWFTGELFDAYITLHLYNGIIACIARYTDTIECTRLWIFRVVAGLDGREDEIVARITCGDARGAEGAWTERGWRLDRRSPARSVTAGHSAASPAILCQDEEDEVHAAQLLALLRPLLPPRSLQGPPRSLQCIHPWLRRQVPLPRLSQCV